MSYEVQAKDERGNVLALRLSEGLFYSQIPAIGDFDGQIKTLGGCTSKGDGGEGLIQWYAEDTSTANNGTIFGTGIGRWKRIFGEDVSVDWFSPTKDGVTNDYAALLAAYTAADALGVNVRFGRGSYAISTTLTMIPTSYVGFFGRVPRIQGAGMSCTTLYNGVANGPMFDVDSASSHVTFKGALGVSFRGFTVRKAGSPAACTAIRLRTSYHPVVEDVNIDGMSANGVEFITSIGDLDASIMATLRNVRIENCAGWGVKTDPAAGANETSFIRMENVFIQACGTASGATPPTSGGMLWRGQVLSMQNCAFAGQNQNVGLFVKGEAGLGSNVNILDTTFENCIGRSLYCTGASVFVAKNIQIYNNSSAVATSGIEFDASTYYISNVDIDGVVVRATSHSNPITMFKISGTNADIDSCRVRNVNWQLYDYTGQTRFDGFKFDSVPMNCQLVMIDSQLVRLTPYAPGLGNAMPLRAVRAIDGNDSPSTTGEWYETNINSNDESLTPTTGSGPEVPITLIEGGAIAASTRYHAYLYNSLGIRQLGLSATAPTVDAVSGYWVRTGDVSKLWVGAVTTTSAASPNIRFSHVESGPKMTGSKIFDPSNLADGAGETTTVTVTGAALGDYARASFSLDLQGVTLTTWVSAADTVSVRFQNESGGAVDLASGVLRATAERA